MKKIAVIPANGIGDALVMLIAAHHLRKLGYQVTVFHPLVAGFGRWLEKGEYLNYSENWNKALSSFDAILLQHNNADLAREILSLRQSGHLIYVFYTTYRYSKHGTLFDHFDYSFDINRTMVENICLGTQALFGQPASPDNGMRPLSGLTHRKYARRVIIHPTSGSEARNWPKKKFLRLFHRLQKMGCQPIFALSPEERDGWPIHDTPLLPTLEDLASLIYESGYFIGNESGPCHLASYLSIPHLVLARNEKHMRLWKPGWHNGIILLPPRWLPNFKGLRWREQKWKHFITTKGVLNRFKSMIK